MITCRFCFETMKEYKCWHKQFFSIFSTYQSDRLRNHSSVRLIVVLFDNSVTRNYFENLVRALENGLSDVDTHAACSRQGSSKGLGGSNRGRSGKSKGSTSKSSGSNKNIDDSGHWSCDHCTYANVNSATVCAMCQHHR